MINHAVCIPFPAHGHIYPMLKIAKLLHFKFGFHITFINTHCNHQTLFQSQENIDIYPNFQCMSLFDDAKDVRSSADSVLDYSLETPVKQLLFKLFDSSKPVTCMITDFWMSKFALDVSEEMGVPAVALEVISACGILAYLEHRQLSDKGIIPLKDSTYLTNGYLDMVIDWIPSLKGISLKEMPTTVRRTVTTDKFVNYVISSEYRALDSQAIVINTFDSLEQDALKDLSSYAANIYTIGPLNLLYDEIMKEEDDISISSKKEDTDYFQWLDSQEPNSILFLCFGTLVKLPPNQFDEFAWGLANSHAKFFWVVRPGLVDGRPNSLPLGFVEETKDRGIVTSWCDQKKVLGHPSIGGFVTQCGWNSMTESISHGVPMICWPILGEQVTSCWYCCNHLGIGIDLTEAKKRDEVARIIEELMVEEKGKDMKKNAIKWSSLAKEATMSPYGSSYVNFEKLVNDVLIKHAT